MQRIAIYGGTFDPIHYGHLRSIAELQSRFSIDQVRLVPSYTPPHRGAPGATAEQRLAMLALAIREFDGMLIDDREVMRQGVSYSVETLREIKHEVIRDFGADTQLFFVLGADAFALLDEWRDWQLLTDYCHLLVMDRPGSGSKGINSLVLEWLEDKLVDDPLDMRATTHGCVCRVHLTQWEISATQIRQRISKDKSVETLLPIEVSTYISRQNLYREAVR